MGTIAQKLQNIIDSKAAISAAIEAKGGTVPTELTGYGAAIEALPSGGGSDVAAKIVDRTVTEITAADLSGATRIASYSFYECTTLTSISIPDSVTMIRTSAFQGCTNLLSVTIPNSVSSMESYAFQNCQSLKSITIPNSLTAIPSYAFLNNISLSSATIGSGVSRILNQAFFNTSNCLSFDFSNHTSIPTLLNVNAFQGTNANKKIIVPDDLYDSWKAANNWNSSTNGIVDAITKASEA